MSNRMPATFRGATLARLVSTRGIPWWTVTVMPEAIELVRPLGGRHRFERDATVLVLGRSRLEGRYLTVRQAGRLDWVVRVARPSRLEVALHAHGWTLTGPSGFDET